MSSSRFGKIGPRSHAVNRQRAGQCGPLEGPRKEPQPAVEECVRRRAVRLAAGPPENARIRPTCGQVWPRGRREREWGIHLPASPPGPTRRHVDATGLRRILKFTIRYREPVLR